MRIVKLQAENVKRLKAVEITPDGHLQVIAGRNAQGKSSVLDAIWFALGGGAAQRSTARPVRDGEDHASVVLNLGDMVVTRTWNGDKTALKVESPEGAVFRSPQTLLDGLIGRFSFDPLAFSQQDERTQLAELLTLVELPFDPAKIDEQRSQLYAERTEVGRRGMQLKGQLDGMAPAGVGLDSVPDEEVSVAELVAELNRRQAIAKANDDLRQQFDLSERSVLTARRELDSLLAQVEAARNTLAMREADDAKLAERVGQITDPDVAAMEVQLANVEQVNRAVRANQERAKVAAEHQDARAKFAELTEQIDALDEKKRAGLAAATFPVDGLGFDDNGVTYAGVPFRQCSGAERLRVSTAMAMALNPKLRVIRITDGSLLDSDNMRLLEEMATEHDFQVWIERVDESGTVGVTIEDGMVAS